MEKQKIYYFQNNKLKLKIIQLLRGDYDNESNNMYILLKEEQSQNDLALFLKYKLQWLFNNCK